MRRSTSIWLVDALFVNVGHGDFLWLRIRITKPLYYPWSSQNNIVILFWSKAKWM